MEIDAGISKHPVSVMVGVLLQGCVKAVTVRLLWA